MSENIYEVVGAIDPAAANAIAIEDAILVDNGGDEHLIAKPRVSEDRGDDE